jgi:hypothetical protein
MQSFLQVLASDPAWIRTGLRIVHFCGLVLGVGAATLLDLIIARFILMRGISYEHVYVVDFSSKVVTIGLGLLWISGIGFLVHYAAFDPAKLHNPKIWAKIAIVAVLSINGLLVHYFVLPRIRNQVGKRLLDGLSPFDCSLVLLAGTVSAISWYVPLILGTIPQLNFVVPAEVILSGYAVLVLAVNTAIQGAIAFSLGDYSIPAISDRSKMNILRGLFALVLALVCGSWFVTRAPDHGEALVDSATTALAGEPKVALAATVVGKDANRSDLELEQPHMGALKDSAVTAVWQSDGKIIERTVLVNSTKAAEQELLDLAGSAESFASLSKGSRGTSPSQLKSGFVGLWAVDARACEFRPGTGSDLLTVIGERGARAGGNSCAFKEKKQVGNSEWEVKAACADGSTRWESTVRLSVSKNKLKWSGQRGTQTYVKCTGEVALGQANL